MSTVKITKVVFREDRAELIEQELPELGTDQILVKTSCTLISPGTERAALTRVWDDAWFRENPGYALAGRVCQVGKDVKNIKVGDRVVTLKNHASFSITSANPWDTLKIPEGVSDEESTFVVLASVALHGLRRAQVSLGETLVIFGAGIIGQMAVQLAKLDGAKKVIVLDMVESRLEQAKRFGADLVINPAQTDAVAQVFEATGGRGASAILEATGNVRAIPQAFKMAAHGGRIICCGLMEETLPIPFNLEFLSRELSLIAAHQPHCPTSDHIYWQWTQQANRELLMEYFATGKIHAAELITHRFKAQAAPQVYEQIKDMNPQMLGVILEWS